MQDQVPKKKDSVGSKWILPSTWSNIIGGRSKSKERLEDDSCGLKRTFSSPDIAVFTQTCPNIQLCRCGRIFDINHGAVLSSAKNTSFNFFTCLCGLFIND
jgi:hypothetical protein